VAAAALVFVREQGGGGEEVVVDAYIGDYDVTVWGGAPQEVMQTLHDIKSYSSGRIMLRELWLSKYLEGRKSSRKSGRRSGRKTP